MKQGAKTGYYLAFLIWPFATLLVALKNYRKPIARPIFVLAISFLGFTASSEGDLDRYKSSFYAFQNQNFGTILRSFFDLTSSDIYVDILAFTTGFFFNSHHVYFAFLFGIFAYLLSGVIVKFLDLLPQKLPSLTLLLLIGFVLFYSIRSIISVRFYTGGLFYLLMMMNYLSTGNKKFIIYSFFAPLFHYGLALVVLAGPLFLLFKNKFTPALILVIASFAIGQSTVVGFLERQTSEYEDTFLERKVKAYASDPGRERLEERYSQGMLNYNWKALSLVYVRTALWYYLVLGIGLIFLYRKKIPRDSIYANLFIFVLILFSLSNIMLNISNGDRYIFLYLFLTLGLFLLLLANKLLPRRLLSYIYLLIPLSILYGLMALYAANPLFSYKFFLFNYIMAIIYGS